MAVGIASREAVNCIEVRPSRVSAGELALFRSQGFLVVRSLVSPAELDDLRRHADDLMHPAPHARSLQGSECDNGSSTKARIDRLEAFPAHMSAEEKAAYFPRVPMLDRKLKLHERYLLHAGVVDAFHALIGPDVKALQSTLFLNAPDAPGLQGRRDNRYIPTHPDTLGGAWIAIDAPLIENPSAVGPVYTPHVDDDIDCVLDASGPDGGADDVTWLTDRFDRLIETAGVGDVVFFSDCIMRYSKTAFGAQHARRAFVGHYGNALSLSEWGAEGVSNGVIARCVDKHRVTKGAGLRIVTQDDGGGFGSRPTTSYASGNGAE
jgi:hypothetical protein